MDKLTSRKFILAVISGISGVAISLSSLDGTIGVICAVVSALVPAITYIVTEGTIDAKAIEMSVSAVKEVTEIIKDGEDDGNNTEGNK